MFIDSCGWSCSLTAVAGPVHWQLSMMMFIDSCGWWCSLTAVAGCVHWQLWLVLFIDSCGWSYSVTTVDGDVYWQLQRAMFIDSYRWSCLLTATEGHVHWQLWLVVFIDSCGWLCSLTAVAGRIHWQLWMVMLLDSYRRSCSLTATEGYVLWQLQGARALVAAGHVCLVCLCFWPCHPCDVVSMVDWVLNSKRFFVHISSPVVRAHNLAGCQGKKLEVVIRLFPSAATLCMNFVIIIASRTSFCSLTLSGGCLEIRVSLWARDSHADLLHSTSSTSPLSSVCPALCHFRHRC